MVDARFDLTLELTVSNGGNNVGGHLEFNEDIITRETAERLINAFKVCTNLLLVHEQYPTYAAYEAGYLTLKARSTRLSPAY